MPQPVPAVPGIPAGWHPVQADLDLWITDTFSYLAASACFRGQLQAAKTISGWTLAQLDTVLEDPYSGWSATATSSQPAYSWLCPSSCPGWYDVTLSAFTGNFSGQIGAALYLNGAAWQYGSENWTPASGDAGSSGAVQVPLTAGDYVQLYLYTSSSVSTPATAGQYPSLELAWIST